MLDFESERSKRETAESVIDSLIASGTVEARFRDDSAVQKRQKVIGWFSV